jgi:hypothetical protein
LSAEATASSIFFCGESSAIAVSEEPGCGLAASVR